MFPTNPCSTCGLEPCRCKFPERVHPTWMVILGVCFMLVLFQILIATSGCGDNAPGPVELLDAAPDAACELEPDANGGCCALYPDENAVRACAEASFPIGACGVVACQKADCSFARVNVCHFSRCADLPCDSLACDENQPPGCTCHLSTTGEYVGCVGVP